VLNTKVKKAIILGSGLTCLESKIPLESIPYSKIPNWPLGKVKGHKGVLDIYDDILVLRGRAHIYEGFSWEEAKFPTRFLVENGIEELIITNAAGGINPDYEIGDLMQITGYLNFIRPGRPRGGLDALTEKIIEFKTELIDCQNDKTDSGASIREPVLRRGVYVGVHGPNYETDAEVALFRNLGASAVGMSTIPELEVAVEHGLRVKAVSIITNVYGKTEDLGHEGVVQVAKQASDRLTKLLGIQ
jgi:purine-nucleoside phosphorylase